MIQRPVGPAVWRKWKSCEVGKSESGIYTELHREGTELHRGIPENYKQMSKKISVVLSGSLWPSV